MLREPALSPITNGVSPNGLIETTVTFVGPGLVSDDKVRLPSEVRTYDAEFVPRLLAPAPTRAVLVPIVDDETDAVRPPPPLKARPDNAADAHPKSGGFVR